MLFRSVEDIYPVLVLAPLRVARSTWPEEVTKWAHLGGLRVSVITGTPKQRQRAFDTPADVYTTNYDNLGWLCSQVPEGEWPFKTVVADEFTRLKSFRLRQGGSRAAALGKVAHTAVSRFIGLTGTPAPNGVKDLWGQSWFLDKGERLGRTFSAFSERWFRKGYDGYSLVPYEHTQAEVQDRLKDICLTVKGLDVEHPLVNPVYVDLPPLARKVYVEMEKSLYTELEEYGVEAANAGNLEAQTNLGWLHAKGIVVKQDFEAALKWIRAAADRKYAPAQYNLGIMHSKGDGVQRDPIEAMKWFSLAAKQGEPRAIAARDALAQELSREHIIEARLRAAVASPLRPMFRLEGQ